MRELFPAIEPYAHGFLDVGEDNQIYWETSGNAGGKPALWVHGGPGSGGRRGSRRMFDPEVYRIILFDQRGCGQSRPHACDPAVSLEHNTTEHLIADMERLREHLGIERWLLYGGSWGSTLILAYAERHPDRVSEIILVGVTMTRPEEIDWLYRGVGRLLPAEWEAFHEALPTADRDGDLVAAYNRLCNSPDPTVRMNAARAWCAWEDAVIAHETLGAPGQYSGKPDDALLAFVRICTHYFAHSAWLEDGQLLRDAHRLAGIPAALIHGRLDLASPLRTAGDLAAAWPDAELKVIAESGHTGSPATKEAIMEAIERFSQADAGPQPSSSQSTLTPSAVAPSAAADSPIRRDPGRRSVCSPPFRRG
ncbi:prolyl aminopeptidase [Pseudofrankia sp. BMG5.37]|uniref:prolyl aminopeptidase n=1 Tax=Pseudofrankia sp. BMG5.37 TaxID=3050035 RepID=UPI002894B728|nr:prolyl aminopeptidase [Pseudofrankia sp. BMG5.37]MDT3446207.1 prolyl aminopeptidase [Pseudofrankia sp. BMG5.37]